MNKKINQKQSTYINPLKDSNFKTLFSKKPKSFHPILEAFFPELKNQILNVKGAQTFQIQDSFSYSSRISKKKGEPSGKHTVLDLIVKLKTGEHILVEIQNYFQSEFFDRMIYYLCRKHGDQLIQGERYEDIKATYLLVFMNFNHRSIRLRKGSIHEVFLMFKDKPHDKISEKLKLICVDLTKHKDFEKYLKEAQKHPQKVDLKELLCYSLKNMARMNKKKFELVKILGGQVTRSFYSSIEELSQDKDYRFWDTRRQMEEDARKDAIFEEGEQKGLKKGLEKGKEGEQKGLKKGRIEGKEEGREEIILKMKQKGMSLSEISEITGLSKEEIKKLSKKEIKKIKQRRN